MTCSLAFCSGAPGPNLQESSAQLSGVATGKGTNERKLQFEAEEELEEHDFGHLGGDDDMEFQKKEAWAEDDFAHFDSGTDMESQTVKHGQRTKMLSPTIILGGELMMLGLVAI